MKKDSPKRIEIMLDKEKTISIIDEIIIDNDIISSFKFLLDSNS